MKSENTPRKKKAARPATRKTNGQPARARHGTITRVTKPPASKPALRAATEEAAAAGSAASAAKKKRASRSDQTEITAAPEAKKQVSRTRKTKTAEATEETKAEAAAPTKSAAKRKTAATPRKTRTGAAAKRPRAKAKKAPLEIPPLLLEGDTPAPPPASGPGQRYALGPTAPAPHTIVAGKAAALPSAYGTKRLLLAARDPHWLYAHWDLTREQQREYNNLSADRHLVLRVYLYAIKGEPFTEVHAHPESTHWFIHVGRGGAWFIGELGYYQRNRKWVSISASGPTLTPPDTLSAEFEAEFATIPFDMPLPQLLVLIKEALRDNVPLAEALLQLRAAGHPELPADLGQPPAQWTAEQEKALAEIISMDQVHRVWMGSLEITELIRRQWQREISSAAAAQFSIPTSPGGAVSSISSPYGGAPAQRGFWFNINAELIIYGATEPDARVTIGGRRIKLRPDGSFSFRFALPDGQYDLPAEAVSAAGDDRRRAALHFKRATEYHGEVGQHPQDASLKAPRAEHVG